VICLRASLFSSGCGGFCVFQITSEINELLSRTRHNRFAAMNKWALFQPQHSFVLRPGAFFAFSTVRDSPSNPNLSAPLMLKNVADFILVRWRRKLISMRIIYNSCHN
jgi:hypothetical protein